MTSRYFRRSSLALRGGKSMKRSPPCQTAGYTKIIPNYLIAERKHALSTFLN